MLLYIVHYGVTLSRAAGTVLQKLFGVRQMHIVLGYQDPLEGKRRVWMAIRGLKRRSGGGKRKLPTTPVMLRWIKDHLRPADNANDAILWLALSLAFFFLMRVGEYAHSGSWDLKKVLTPADLSAR